MRSQLPDALCALRWIVRNADDYGFDTDRIVATGHTAGGHLALTTGMIPSPPGRMGVSPTDWTSPGGCRPDLPRGDVPPVLTIHGDDPAGDPKDGEHEGLGGETANTRDLKAERNVSGSRCLKGRARMVGRALSSWKKPMFAFRATTARMTPMSM
ncbi:MAG: alpha/beta hydrolase [Gemmatimonadota bacterium]